MTNPFNLSSEGKKCSNVLIIRPLNVASVVLVSHNHEVFIPHTLLARVLLPVLQPHYFLDVVYLRVVHQLLVPSFCHIQMLSLQREHTVVISPDNRKAACRHGLCRVLFGEDESSVKLKNSSERGFFYSHPSSS